ncbi:type IV pilus assembly protein PilE [Pseudomonas graminis]|uniref:type IV pilin protein n=1 Tax=Pseudomonas graminis TaxID=158627 RepID=UPI00105E2441|nr:type IV pilin protein [Pseudomonas graminis]TDV51190.1 type IV pilus assembly protein PilE [Pseudomonas graminis]
MQCSNRSERGFTLIELMITVAIVAILAAIAYPSYTKYVQRGYRSEGIVMLNDAVARMERYYAQNNTYAVTNLTALGFASATPLSQTGKYQLSVTANATAYSFTATPKDQQTQDACGALTIDQAGAKTSAGGTDCFK